MSKLYTFAAIFLFWAALATSLMQVQLLASPMHKLQVPTYRSVCIRATGIAQLQAGTTSTVASYN